MKASINIRQHLSKFLVPTPEDKDPQVAVSGIWVVPIQNQPSNCAVVVACEKVPALLVFSSSTINSGATNVTVVDQQIQDLNPLDVAIVGQQIAVSLDARLDDQKRTVVLQLAANDNGVIEVARNEEAENKLKQLNDLTGIEEDPKSLETLLYGVKNLKKRTGWADQGEE
jgi:tRNA (guanine-N(7)-)-methyltransferase subunit TRM82